MVILICYPIGYITLPMAIPIKATINVITTVVTKMTVDERLQQIADMTQMSESDIEILKKKNALSLETADSMIDHVIGTYALPIGVARGFVINGKEYVVPMVCEEPWVVSRFKTKSIFLF